MSDAKRRPDWEIRRKCYAPSTVGDYRVHKGWRTYAHGYWRPLIVVVLGHVLIGRRRLRRSQENTR